MPIRPVIYHSSDGSKPEPPEDGWLSPSINHPLGQLLVSFIEGGIVDEVSHLFHATGFI